jgi:predicted 3-demethylubiquinone-9 3-methyltransferase (glyoxalase superfamily)
MQKITPFLWFDNQAEEAATLYTSIFRNSEILNISHYGEGAPVSKGTVMSVTFTLDGQEYIAFNGGPHFKLTEAISLFVKCSTQGEIDELWEKLSEGGEKQRCGWLKDRFGLSWQIIPPILGEMLRDTDPQRAGRVMEAMLKMSKINIRTLEEAYEGKAVKVK